MSSHVRHVRHARHAALAFGAAAPLSLFLCAPPANAQTPSAPALETVVVTANPLGSGLFGIAQPVGVLDGALLDARRAASLGETLSGEPGVSATAFGPNASRPVIRGLDADRIRLLQNGATSLDASSLSYDHAVAIEPLVAERIEIVRGPAALLYGGSALGGAVNVIDNRIPGAPIEGVSGRAELRYGGAARERAGVALLEGGNGRIAWHADAYRRSTDDLRIPGFARSARQRELDAAADPPAEQPRDRLPNTASRSEGGALGAAWTWASGHAGVSFGSLRSDYGTPAEEDVSIRMRKDSVDFSSELRELPGLVKTLRLRASHADYHHDEVERADGEVHARFENRGHELRVEAVHADLGPLKGMLGLQHGSSSFSAQGHEAFLPRTRSRTTALFVHEELARPGWKLGFGARLEQGRIASAGGGVDGHGSDGHEDHGHDDHDHDGHDAHADEDRFGPALSRRFSARSLSSGLILDLAPGLALAANASYTERMPTHYELFSNGPHAATGTWEIGDPSLDKERSGSLELALRYRSGPNRASLGIWQTRFSNYLQLSGTGRLRGEDGSLEDPATPGVTTTGEAAELPEYVYRQVPATFRGLELQLARRLLERAGTLDLELKADRVQAFDRGTGRPLPRIAPLRYGAALVWRSGPLLLRGEAMRVAAQRRVADGELPTDAYTMVDAYASWRVRDGRVAWDLFARGSNLLNAEARSHSSLIKDIAPLGGRSLLVGMRATF